MARTRPPKGRRPQAEGREPAGWRAPSLFLPGFPPPWWAPAPRESGFVLLALNSTLGGSEHRSVPLPCLPITGLTLLGGFLFLLHPLAAPGTLGTCHPVRKGRMVPGVARPEWGRGGVWGTRGCGEASAPPSPHWHLLPRSSGSWTCSPRPPPCAASTTCEWLTGLGTAVLTPMGSALGWGLPASIPCLGGGWFSPERSASPGRRGRRQEGVGGTLVRLAGAVCQLLCLLLSFNTTKTPLPVLTGLAPAPGHSPGAQIRIWP